MASVRFSANSRFAVKYFILELSSRKSKTSPADNIYVSAYAIDAYIRP